MSASNRTVSRLALRAGMDPELALVLLFDAGFSVKSVHCHILARDYALAEAVLQLVTPRRPVVLPRDRPKKSQAAIQTSAGAIAPVEPERPKLRRKKDFRPREDRVVGRRQPLLHLEAAEVESIHWTLVRDFGRSRDPIDPPGVKSENMLASACTRCQTSLGGEDKYPTASMAAAALLHSLVLNHPFHNGNKRTGLVSLLVFLDRNRWRLHAEEEDLYEFVVQVAGHSLEVSARRKDDSTADSEVLAMAEWLDKRIRAINLMSGYHRLKWRNLKSVLSKYRCTFDVVPGNKLRIHRGEFRTTVWYGDDGRDIERNLLVKIRKDLHLDVAAGVDDDMFYDSEAGLPSFVNKYRKTLDRLAKV